MTNPYLTQVIEAMLKYGGRTGRTHEGTDTMTNTTTLSNGASRIKRGDTMDREDWRFGNRAAIAISTLKIAGVEPTKVHYGPYSPDDASAAGDREARSLHARYYCSDRCKTEWSGEPTNEVFEAAWALGCAVQDSRAARTSRAINTTK